MGQYQESIARYHEVRLAIKKSPPFLLRSLPVRASQALSIAPGDPVTCDLLKLALEDTANCVSTGSFAFPGLPPSVLWSVDQQVALLDADILAGVPPIVDGEDNGDMERSNSSEYEIVVDADVDEGVTDEGFTGQSLSMDME